MGEFSRPEKSNVEPNFSYSDFSWYCMDFQFPSPDKIFEVHECWDNKNDEIILAWNFFLFGFCLYKIPLCFDFWKLQKELSEKHQNNDYFPEKKITFGTAKSKRQEWAQVFQWILNNWNIAKMLKKICLRKLKINLPDLFQSQQVW